MIFMGLSIGENANRLVPRNRPAFDLLRTDRNRIDCAAVSKELSLLFLVHLDIHKLTPIASLTDWLCRWSCSSLPLSHLRRSIVCNGRR